MAIIFVLLSVLVLSSLSADHTAVKLLGFGARPDKLFVCGGRKDGVYTNNMLAYPCGIEFFCNIHIYRQLLSTDM